VAHISTLSRGGAAVAAYELHQSLSQHGCDSTMLVLQPPDASLDVKQIAPAQQTLSPELWRGAVRYWKEIESMHPFASRTKSHYSSPYSEISLANMLGDYNVIHLHWVAGILNLQELSMLAKHASIVWTLHDANPFTGGCHYPQSCERYLEQCHHCPQLGPPSSGAFLLNTQDPTSQNWRFKRDHYNMVDMTIVTPSRWLQGCAQSSALLQSKSFAHIPYSIDVDLFCPHDNARARVQLGIPVDTSYILFGADNLSDHRKGPDLCRLVLHELATRYTENFTVLLFGGSENPFPDLPINVISLGRLDHELLPYVYAASDVYLLASREDNLPNTCIESLACGTPVAAFDVAGMSEMIEHQITGCLAPFPDTAKLAEGIQALLHSTGRSARRRACRVEALKTYSRGKQANRYMELYRKLLNQHRGGEEQ
jgi:glycosyltransferase involved in cell wall biosynthesis